MIYVKTPATTANLGCGFDSIGMAFQMYNELWAEETDSGFSVKVLREQEQPIPTDEGNLIYKTMKDFYQAVGKKLPGIRLYQKDSIPMTRGLGSSAACVVSGLLAANELSGAKLPLEEMVQMSAKLEGHPDNAAPALLGGIVVGALDEKELKYVRIPVPEALRFAVLVPSFPLSTEAARGVLPEMVPHKDAIFNTSRAGLLIASLMTGQLENLQMSFDDRLHQPYRKSIIPNMESIFEQAKALGAKGVFLSGAGPTIVAVLDDAKDFEQKMQDYFATIDGGWTAQIIAPDETGAVVGTQELPAESVAD